MRTINRFYLMFKWFFFRGFFSSSPSLNFLHFCRLFFDVQIYINLSIKFISQFCWKKIKTKKTTTTTEKKPKTAETRIFWRLLQLRRVNDLPHCRYTENISVSLLLNEILWHTSSSISMCMH